MASESGDLKCCVEAPPNLMEVPVKFHWVWFPAWYGYDVLQSYSVCSLAAGSKRLAITHLLLVEIQVLLVWESYSWIEISKTSSVHLSVGNDIIGRFVACIIQLCCVDIDSTRACHQDHSHSEWSHMGSPAALLECAGQLLQCPSIFPRTAERQRVRGITDTGESHKKFSAEALPEEETASDKGLSAKAQPEEANGFWK